MAERSIWAPAALLLVLLAAGTGVWWSLQGGEEEVVIDGEAPLESDEAARAARRRAALEAGDPGAETPAGNAEAVEAPIGRATLTGLAVDGIDGRELENVTIRAESTRGTPVAETRSLEGGVFRLDLPAGDWKIRALAGPRASEVLTVGGLAEAEERDVGVLLLLPTSRISGRVVNADLRPLEGVEVALFRGAELGRAAQGLDFFRLIEDILEPEPPLEKVETGPDGSFAFEGVLNGDYAVAATKAGMRRALSKRLRVDDRVGASRLDLVLVPGLSLRGRCVDDAELPLAGVKLLALAETNGFPGPGSTRIVFSDEDGRFEIPGVDMVEHQILVRHPGYAAASSLRAKPDEELIVRLNRGCVLRGAVRDVNTGAPVAGLRVMAISNEQPTIVETQTDAEGRYELASLPDRASIMIFVRSDLYFLKSEVEADIEVIGSGAQVRLPRSEQPRREVEQDLLVMKGGIIEGRVLDQDSGEPVAGANVVASGGGGPFGMFGGGSGASAVSGSDGRFRLVNVVPGPFMVRASHPDYAPPGMKDFESMFMGMRGGRDGEDPRPKLASGETKTGVEVRIRRGLVVRGRVVDEEGAPVARARVSVTVGSMGMSMSMAMLGGGTPRETVSDAKGRFELRGVAPAESAAPDGAPNPFAAAMTPRLVASHPAYAGGGSVELAAPSGRAPEDLEIVIKRGASLRGVLLDENGAPAPGRFLGIEVENESGGMGGMMDVFSMDGANTYRVTTDAAGRFAVPSMPHGKVQISLTSGGTEMINQEEAAFEVRPGEKKEVRLRLLRTVGISGVVVNEDGVPLRAMVSANVAGAERNSGRSDSSREDDGAFEITGLPEGREVTLTVWSWGGDGRMDYEPLTVDKVRTGSTGLRLVMKRKPQDD